MHFARCIGRQPSTDLPHAPPGALSSLPSKCVRLDECFCKHLKSQSCPHTLPGASRALLQAPGCEPTARTPPNTPESFLPCTCAHAFAGTFASTQARASRTHASGHSPKQCALHLCQRLRRHICNQSCPHTLPKALWALLQAPKHGPPARTPPDTPSSSLPCACAGAFACTFTHKGAHIATCTHARNVRWNLAHVFTSNQGSQNV